MTPKPRELTVATHPPMVETRRSLPNPAKPKLVAQRRTPKQRIHPIPVVQRIRRSRQRLAALSPRPRLLQSQFRLPSHRPPFQPRLHRRVARRRLWQSPPRPSPAVGDQRIAISARAICQPHLPMPRPRHLDWAPLRVRQRVQASLRWAMRVARMLCPSRSLWPQVICPQQSSNRRPLPLRQARQKRVSSRPARRDRAPVQKQRQRIFAPMNSGASLQSTDKTASTQRQATDLKPSADGAVVAAKPEPSTAQPACVLRFAARTYCGRRDGAGADRSIRFRYSGGKQSPTAAIDRHCTKPVERYRCHIGAGAAERSRASDRRDGAKRQEPLRNPARPRRTRPHRRSDRYRPPGPDDIPSHRGKTGNAHDAASGRAATAARARRCRIQDRRWRIAIQPARPILLVRSEQRQRVHPPRATADHRQ